MSSSNASEISIVRKDHDRGKGEGCVFARIEQLKVEDLKPHTFRYKAIHTSSAVLANRMLLKHLKVTQSSICFVEPVIPTQE